MPAVANEQAYQDMINMLNNFMKQVSEQCSVMEKAAADCVDNFEDPAATAAQGKIAASISNIKAQYEEMQNAIKYMQEEIERIREKNKKAVAEIDNV